MNKISAAHRTLPFGSVVLVRNLDNGRELRVPINDRGPFIKGRIIDLSHGAAQRLGVIGPGTALVEIVLVEPATSRPAIEARHATRSTRVQLGAFRNKESAERLAERAVRLDSRVQIRERSGWYRVQVQAVDGDEARRLAERFQNEGYDAIIVNN